ncbi:6-bladed beta-propeller [Alkaliflexus imshenetskii]|uniref:6-bladed beta-propeller n=1 Tax=Alkaliflexus imshenetskii TaxID=286730 RepID=UPI00047A2BBB|nr:6-bladed beta-propeller [Alkaliflexus imshenetskii]
MKKVIILLWCAITVLSNSCIGKVGGSVDFYGFDYSEIATDVKLAIVEEEGSVVLPTNCIEYDTKLMLSDVFSMIEVVPLESLESSLIGGIDKLVSCDTTILVIDKYKTKSIKQFTKRGGFVGVIGSNGRGPGQYYEPTDCVVYKDTILVYDQFQQKIIFYGNRGEFLKEKKVPFTFNSFYVFDNNSFIFQMYDNDNDHINEILGYSLIWCDSMFNIQHKSLYKEKDKYNTMINSGLTLGLDKVYFHPPYSDSVYQVEENGVIKLAYLLEMHTPLPAELLLRKNGEKLSKMSYETPNNYMLFTGIPYISNKKVLYEISFNRRVQFVFFHSELQKCIAGDLVVNDLSRLVGGPGKPIFAGSDYLITYEHAYRIKETMESYKKHGLDVKDFLNAREQMVAEKLKDYSNPVLFFYCYKDE